jgi:hypothetical protein
MRADCQKCRCLQREYEDISEAYLALHKRNQSEDTAKHDPSRAATLNQGFQYIENEMATVTDAIRQHEAEAHPDLLHDLAKKPYECTKVRALASRCAFGEGLGNGDHADCPQKCALAWSAGR